MAMRRKLSRKASRKSFRKGVTRIAKKNLRSKVLRGGIRL